MSPDRGTAAIALLGLALLAAGCELNTGSDAQDAKPPSTAKVLRVVDGDTIQVDLDGDTEYVRYIGIDTPETVKPDTPVQCFGPEASARNHELVAEGETVRLEFDQEYRDAYDRLLAYVYVGKDLINADLIRGGYARTLEIEPNTARADQMAKLETRAGDAGKGLWGAC